MEKQMTSTSIEGIQVDATMSSLTAASTATSTFHIYHVGSEKRPKKYSIHSVRDSETTILIPPKVKKDKKNKKKKEKEAKSAKSSSTTALQTTTSNKEDTRDLTSTPQTDITLPTTTEDNQNRPIPTPELVPVKGIKKLGYLDNPKHDPRAQTAPYYLHLPNLFLKEPPYTLRYGGTKRGPVACILHEKSFWLGWKLEFGDVLRQEGVIDGRGVVNARYGTKKGKDGYLKGFKVGKRRWWGESGKAYWRGQKEAGWPDNEMVGVDGDGLEKVRAEEVVRLKWLSPWSPGKVREYGFEWRGFGFVWKGTRKVESRKAARAWVWCNHLKLVVRVVVEEGKEEELCLVRYSCAMGWRKAGKVEVFEDVMDAFLQKYLFKDGKEEGSESPIVVAEEEEAKTRQRLKDIIMGTMICMIITERDKRRWLLELLQEIGENAGG